MVGDAEEPLHFVVQGRGACWQRRGRLVDWVHALLLPYDGVVEGGGLGSCRSLEVAWLVRTVWMLQVRGQGEAAVANLDDASVEA